LQKAAFIIKSLYKWGTKRLCKALLKSQRLDAVDTDTVYEFERVLTDVGLPADVELLMMMIRLMRCQLRRLTQLLHPPYFTSSHPSYDDYDTVHTQLSRSDFVVVFYPSPQICLFALHLTVLFGFLLFALVMIIMILLSTCTS
jgi:hypothetical protein